VAKLKSIRQQRPPKRFRIPSSVVQWGIVGVVAIVLAVLVIGALSRPPAEPAPVPLLSSVKIDLLSMTRMLGDVRLDSSVRAEFPGELNAGLAGPDSLFAQHRWYDALSALNRLLKKATRPESAAISAYVAFCDYEADNMDRALQAFRKSLALDSNPTGIAPRLTFDVGWLFQSRGYQDSALVYYTLARRSLPDTNRLLRAVAANNAGVAGEVLRDTVASSTAYNEALALLDTIAYPKEKATIRANLARLTGRR
jgi:tetratricopeptide (TPR) repeat protein